MYGNCSLLLPGRVCLTARRGRKGVLHLRWYLTMCSVVFFFSLFFSMCVCVCVIPVRKGTKGVMVADAASRNGGVSGDERILHSNNDTQEDQIRLSNTIKSFHYHLQQKMKSVATGEPQEEEKLWFRLMAEEAEHMKSYAIAMHDVATRYWDSHQRKEDTGCRYHAECTDAVPFLPFKGLKRQRTADVKDTNRYGSAGSDSPQYNDRVGYTLHCLADYYLGECLMPLQSKERKHETVHNGDNIISETIGATKFSTRANEECFVRLPRITAAAAKEWRRNFYTIHGHQASASEVEAAVYNFLVGWGTPKGSDDETSVSSMSLLHIDGKPAEYHCNVWVSAPSLAATYMSLSQNEIYRHRSRLLRSNYDSDVSSNIAGNDSDAETSSRLPLPLRVLDVGSCYGPFREKNVTNGVLSVPLLVTALDLCPYEGSDVIQGDWLSVRFVEVRGGSEAKEPSEHMMIGSAEPLVRPNEDPGKVTGERERYLSVGRGQFDAVFFCLLLSFLPHPRLRYRACLHAHLALKDGGLLVIVSTRTQGARRSSWIDDWITCIEGIGFRRVHKSIMKQLVGMSFSRVAPAGSDGRGDAAAWLERMMSRSEADYGLCTVSDNCG